MSQKDHLLAALEAPSRSSSEGSGHTATRPSDLFMFSYGGGFLGQYDKIVYEFHTYGLKPSKINEFLENIKNIYLRTDSSL